MQVQYRTCVACNALFPVTKRNSDKRFCSKRCYDHERGARPTLTRTCSICASPFTVKANKAATRGHYCSRACWHARPQLGKSYQCAMCQRTFYVFPTNVRRRTPHYCSRACAGLARRHPNQGERGRVTYIAWRLAVLVRDGWTCQRCGAQPQKLMAHHVKFWDAYPDARFDPGNGMVLCAPCHGQVHSEARRLGRVFGPVA